MMIYIGNLPVGRNVRALRRRKGISLACLAEITGLSYLRLLCMETGILKDIDFHHLCAVCRALNVRLEDLTEKKW